MAEHKAKELKREIQNDILQDLKNSKKLVIEICNSLIKIFQNKKLSQHDLGIIKYNLSDDLLDKWNLNFIPSGSDEKILPEVELQNFYLYLEKLKNFKYKNQRSDIAKEIFSNSKMKRLDNCDYIELMCQHVDNAMLIADIITDKILEKDLDSWRIDTLKEIHPIMDQGKTAKTVFENINWILKFQKALESGDTDNADNIMRDLVDSYEA